MMTTNERQLLMTLAYVNLAKLEGEFGVDHKLTRTLAKRLKNMEEE